MFELLLLTWAVGLKSLGDSLQEIDTNHQPPMQPGQPPQHYAASLQPTNERQDVINAFQQRRP